MLDGNSGAGVFVLTSTGVEVTDNTIAESGDNGIVLDDSNGNLIVGNDVRFNPGGIGLSGSSGNRIESNHTGSGSGAGIELADLSFDNVVIGNLAIGNDSDGISVSDVALPGDGNLIEGNTASNNASDGIFAASGHTITGNTVNFNDGWGIFAEPGAIDGGGNKAVGNTEPTQCSGVVCEIGANPGAPDTVILDKPTDPSQQQPGHLHVRRHRRHDAAGQPRLRVPPRHHRRAGVGGLREPAGVRGSVRRSAPLRGARGRRDGHRRREPGVPRVGVRAAAAWRGAGHHHRDRPAAGLAAAGGLLQVRFHGAGLHVRVLARRRGLHAVRQRAGEHRRPVLLDRLRVRAHRRR